VAYATVTDVENLNPQRGRYDVKTVPTRQQVEGYLEQIAAEIDSVLAAQGLSTPVSAPATFLTFITRLNALGAAAQAELGAFPEAEGSLGGSFSGARYQRMYEAGLARLVKGEAIPPAAGTAGARVQAAAYGTDNPDPVTGDPPAPLFSMSQSF
jgi:hypothetical protein